MAHNHASFADYPRLLFMTRFTDVEWAWSQNAGEVLVSGEKGKAAPGGRYINRPRGESYPVGVRGENIYRESFRAG